MKEFCPNLVDELGYKEWSPETAERVQAWINIVLEGKNPTAVIAPTTTTATVATAAPATPATPAAPATPATPAAEPADTTDDLPF